MLENVLAYSTSRSGWTVVEHGKNAAQLLAPIAGGYSFVSNEIVHVTDAEQGRHRQTRATLTLKYLTFCFIDSCNFYCHV